MFSLNTYRKPANLADAYALLMADKANTILGGMLWMKMGRKAYGTGIDLSGLGLDRITERDDFIELGCMTTLRQMEVSPLLKTWFGPLFRQAFAPIVGVQFRNSATLGGSIYPRFGFSDVLTSLMLLGTQVMLFKAGTMDLAAFLTMPQKRDILVSVQLPKVKWETAYQSIRKTATDLPVLSVAVGRSRKKWRITAGARPGRAMRVDSVAGGLSEYPETAQITEAGRLFADEISLGTDSRASSSYRRMLAPVLLERGIETICS